MRIPVNRAYMDMKSFRYLFRLLPVQQSVLQPVSVCLCQVTKVPDEYGLAGKAEKKTAL